MLIRCSSFIVYIANGDHSYVQLSFFVLSGTTFLHTFNTFTHSGNELVPWAKSKKVHIFISTLLSGLTDVLYLINNVDMYDAQRRERLGENGCELSE